MRKNSIENRKQIFLIIVQSIPFQSIRQIYKNLIIYNNHSSSPFPNFQKKTNFEIYASHKKNRPPFSFRWSLGNILKDTSLPTRDNNFLEHRETPCRVLVTFQRINRRAPPVSPAISDRISRQHRLPSTGSRDRKRCPDIEGRICLTLSSSFT